MESRLVVDVQLSGGSVRNKKPKVQELGEEKDLKSTQNSESDNQVAKSAIQSALISSGKQLAMAGLSSYGNITGDYITQQRVQEGVSLASTAWMMTKFPVGTIAGGTSLALGVISNVIQQRNQNLDIDMLRQRAGNETVNKSKGR